MKHKKHLKEFMYKSFAPFSRNSIILQDDYLYPILEAARSNCYVENTGNKADSLQRRIKQTYEEDIVKAYKEVIFPLIKYQRIINPVVAIDITDENFYGLFSDLYLHPWTGEEGVKAKYKFAVISLVKNSKIPLLAVPFHCGMDKAELIKYLLTTAKKIFKNIAAILLDAGFYSGAVILALEKERYLIRAPQNSKIQEFIIDTNKGKWKTFEHEIEWLANKTTNRVKTNIVIVRDVKLRNTIFDCSYATNIKLSNGMDYVYLYCKRWQIETNFRMEDQVHIKSKSIAHIIRYFYFMISLLLHALWLFFYNHKIAFDVFKIQLANEYLFLQLGISYTSAFS